MRTESIYIRCGETEIKQEMTGQTIIMFDSDKFEKMVKSVSEAEKKRLEVERDSY